MIKSSLLAQAKGLGGGEHDICGLPVKLVFQAKMDWVNGVSASQWPLCSAALEAKVSTK